MPIASLAAAVEHRAMAPSMSMSHIIEMSPKSPSAMRLRTAGAFVRASRMAASL
eukprot:CAMPEP_0196700996 /NCGR_PEP_ID=MMETSP1090-20130531/50484_1 /TAXON_ID=37098 /ORGANISM="Isochrysis sp, Strain CCMP1244" /LENGTH=53 /DNA_ID=CAMNT_0042040751 /DNA_START=30 /DNA_END=188 /DNA_ORIENTATION=+